MRSLAKILDRPASQADPIDVPLDALKDLRFTLRRGQLSLWIAGPGVGKSAVALHVAVKSTDGVLYVSSDTDASDQMERVAAILSGDTLDEVRGAIAAGEPSRYRELLRNLRPTLRFCFDSQPTPVDIANECRAYAMVFGRWPDLVIVDTIGKVWSDGEETARNKEAVERCQEIARFTGAHVAALHHATKGFDSGDKPIPLDGLMSGVSKIPEQVLSMWRASPTSLCFSPTKNRSGPSDPTAMQLRSWASVDLTRMSITTLRVDKPANEEWRSPDANQPGVQGG